ncbi:MAG: RNA polymerase sigma-70 factor [Candidatus Pedobacter colombiensis]|uniref:RNA polymerase sigma-70 factor n=1 Tax=Candidatus Pedobacter colombiensis TaxID=3121371 RepID=A0AAJ6BAU7_9SPHI|nr:RNA polymerase sigma-70 factor [Pedobacter sp.]WEK21633.1 MAG: RNA polymerase sigma-70 factor [Pedobacter sp.]
MVRNLIINYNNSTERELIELWKKGNEEIFEYFYNRHVIKLLSIATHKVGNPDVAQELVQDTFLSLYKKKQEIREETNLAAYLYIALKKNILNHYRKESTHKKYETYVLSHRSELDHSTEWNINTKELEFQIIEEIEKLPPQCRAVFKLSRLDGMSDKTIATTLSISVNTVEQHKRKALRILRFAFKDYLGTALILYLLR